MADHDAFRERLFKVFQFVFARNLPQRRRLGVWARAGAGGRMAGRALGFHQRFARAAAGLRERGAGEKGEDEGELNLAHETLCQTVRAGDMTWVKTGAGSISQRVIPAKAGTHGGLRAWPAVDGGLRRHDALAPTIPTIVRAAYNNKKRRKTQ